MSDDNQVIRIAPDKQNPYSWRDFCSKGRNARQVVHHPCRLRFPMRRVGDRYERASWEDAISDIAGRLRMILDRHGPDAIGLYWGNPAGFSPSNPTFAVGFMEALGTRQRYCALSVDTNNLHVVAEALYGSPLFTLVPDVDECMCFLLVGMNPAASAMHWVENVPDGWRRVLAAQARGADVIVVDPRRTATAAEADLHIAVRPGQDWAVLLGVLKVIFERGWEHPDDCANLASGLEDVREFCRRADLEELARRSDVAVETIVDVARRFAQAPTAMCISHTGVSQHTTGTLGEWFAHLLNLVTGRIDRPGGRRFERGYVDTLALWKRFAPSLGGLSRVRGLPAVAGYHAVSELADEILTPGEGQIRALILDAGNPVVTGPSGARLDEALETLELLVVIDLVQRESHRHAHWLIPDAHFLERSELFALSSQFQERPFVQYARKAVERPPNVREAWEFFTDVALAMDVPLFGRPIVNRILKGTRRLATVTGKPTLAFNPEWIDRILVARGRRLKWKDIVARPHGWLYAEKEFGHFAGALLTPDKRVNAAPPKFVAEAGRVLDSPMPQDHSDYPFLLLSQRHRDTQNSWLSELPGVRAKKRFNDVEIHPADAARLGIKTGDIVRVSSPSGSIELPANVTDVIRVGAVVIEQGWGSRVFDPIGNAAPMSFGVNRNLLVRNDHIDPLSQNPALNSQAVCVERLSSRPDGEATVPRLEHSEGERGMPTWRTRSEEGTPPPHRPK